MATKQKDKDLQDAGSDNVGQIREILFGGHLRAFDERFELVESHLAKETDALRKAIEKRVLELERLLTEFREDAGDHLGAETSNRELALNKLELALGQSQADSDMKMAAMEERLVNELKQIRADMQAIHKELTNALSKADQQQTKVTEKLDEDKVARQDLADLFTGLAKHLNPGTSK